MICIKNKTNLKNIKINITTETRTATVNVTDNEQVWEKVIYLQIHPLTPLVNEKSGCGNCAKGKDAGEFGNFYGIIYSAHYNLHKRDVAMWSAHTIDMSGRARFYLHWLLH
jgi:hypothetical protein